MKPTERSRLTGRHCTGRRRYENNRKVLLGSKIRVEFICFRYDEIKDYNYNRPGFSVKTGHFTQVCRTDCSSKTSSGFRQKLFQTIVCSRPNPKTCIRFILDLVNFFKVLLVAMFEHGYIFLEWSSL